MKKKILILFLILCLFFVSLFVTFKLIFPKKYSNYVIVYAEKYDLDRALVYAVILAESGFDASAKSSSGAMGLMQILPSTASWIASEMGENFTDNDLYNAETNIKFGCFYLSYLYKKFGDTKTAICAYNAGEGAISGWLDENGKIDESKIAYGETKNYLKRVMGYYKVYKNNLLGF